MQPPRWLSRLGLLITGLAILVSAGCGGAGSGGAGGGSTGDDIGKLLGYQAAEGTRAAPLQISGVDTVWEGTVATGGSAGISDVADSFYVAQVTPGIEYLVTLAGHYDDADLHVYNDDGSFQHQDNQCGAPEERIATETCTLTATRDALYIAVDGFKTQKGTTFTLSVQEKPTAQGKAADRFLLGATLPTAFRGTVDTSPAQGIGMGQEQDSYYVVYAPYPPLGAGAGIVPVTVTLTRMTDDADLYIFAPSTGDGCASTSGSTENESCSVMVAQGTRIEIGVDGNYSRAGASYTLSIIATPAQEGTEGTPRALGTAPVFHQGSVKGLGEPGVGDVNDSYYVVTGVVPGQEYVINLDNRSDKANLYVFDKDNRFAVPVCPEPDYSVGTADQTCRVTATGFSMYIGVDGSETVTDANDAGGASYTLSVFPVPASEGTAAAPSGAPLGVSPHGVATGGTAGPFDLEGNLDPGDTFLQVNVTGTPTSACGAGSGYQCGTLYTVALKDLTEDVDLYVYDKETLEPICQSATYGTVAGESCTFGRTANTQLLIVVDGFYTANGATFKLSVTTPLAQGTLPAPLTLPAPPVSFRGTVASGSSSGLCCSANVDSFYRVPVKPGKKYSVKLTNQTTDVDVWVFNATNFFQIPTSEFTAQQLGLCVPFSSTAAEEDCSSIGPLYTGLTSNYMLYAPVTASGNYMLVAVNGYYTPGAFTLEVAEDARPFTPVEPGQPLTTSVTKGGVPGAGTVDREPFDRYFAAFGLAPGQDATVTLTPVAGVNPAADLDLYVHGDDPSFSNAIPDPAIGRCVAAVGGVQVQVCTVRAPSSGGLYFAVDGAWIVGASGVTTADFTLTVTQP